MDEGIEGMLITFADDRKLGGIANMMDVSINIQSDFAGWNRMDETIMEKVNKNKREAQHLEFLNGRDLASQWFMLRDLRSLFPMLSKNHQCV